MEETEATALPPRHIQTSNGAISQAHSHSLKLGEHLQCGEQALSIKTWHRHEPIGLNEVSRVLRCLLQYTEVSGP